MALRLGLSAPAAGDHYEIHSRWSADDLHSLHEWLAEWGVADPETVRGGVVRGKPTPPARQVTMLRLLAQAGGPLTSEEATR